MAPAYTRRQHEVLSFVSSFHSTHGYPPTYREIGSALGIAAPTVKGHVDALRKKGALTIQPYEVRSIQLLEIQGASGKGRDAAPEIPIHGEVGEFGKVEMLQLPHLWSARKLLGLEGKFLALRVKFPLFHEIRHGDVLIVREVAPHSKVDRALVLVSEQGLPAPSILRAGAYRLDRQRYRLLGVVTTIIRRM